MTKTINLSEYLLKLPDYQKKRLNTVCGECPKRSNCYIKGVCPFFFRASNEEGE